MENLLDLPSAGLLEEINLPKNMVKALAGKTVRFNFTRKKGAWPMQVYFSYHGQAWRLPRRWLKPAVSAPPLDASYSVTQEAIWTEKIHMPSKWDMWELNLNIPVSEILLTAGRPTTVEVHANPGERVKVFWRDSSGAVWRIPHDWRRRRIKLPSYELLVAQGIPPGVAQEYAGKAVSVNYHPGSLCCLPDAYRFRDSEGNRWPVRMRDCLLLGYGDEEEHRA